MYFLLVPSISRTSWILILLRWFASTFTLDAMSSKADFKNTTSLVALTTSSRSISTWSRSGARGLSVGGEYGACA